jgi:hypothetical protein
MMMYVCFALDLDIFGFVFGFVGQFFFEFFFWWAGKRDAFMCVYRYPLSSSASLRGFGT